METLKNKKPEDVLPVVTEEAIEVKEKEESEKEIVEEEEAKSDDEEKTEKIKGSSKRGRKGSVKKGQSGSKKAKTDSTPVTPIERPTRERKTVERYQESVGRITSPKPISIEKGTGTQLKDIPNVAYMLSKRKSDDLLQALHLVLFNKRAKVHSLKRNIGMFSGFAWDDDEQEKQKTKLKEKLDKCTREKLNDFCDVLNLQIYKSQLKKEEISLKVFEFLQSPHATTDVLLLAEKDQKVKKRKAKAKKSRTPSTKQSGEKRKRSSKIQEEENVDEGEASESGDDDSQEEDEKVTVTPSKPENNEEEEEKLKESGDEEKEKSEADGDEEKEKPEDECEPEKKVTSKKSSSKKSVKKDDVKSATKSYKKSSAPGSKKVADMSSKKSKEEKNSKTADTKSSAKKELSKDIGERKTNKKTKAEPSNEDMHAVVTKILKEVDFNTATLSDIIKQLGTHFGQDLLHRKAEVKAIITDVINNMSGEEDEDDGEQDE